MYIYIYIYDLCKYIVYVYIRYVCIYTYIYIYTHTYRERYTHVKTGSLRSMFLRPPTTPRSWAWQDSLFQTKYLLSNRGALNNP